ncbi:protein ALTERED PHOSPHATE STARVATION RESPONSE 1-like [Primulina eburnea]|uniref:protein ALTERED PHOSPHATE STARVATION RESPONSE 1-like n=1 Tax=Primulina eburnea TaxID=1245227 RepID=UPI003C6C1D77
MVSGSHASTLDKLYAWEKKLYDEVKAGQVLRSNFGQKCKFLLLQESRGQSTEKARYVVKDLHSRIRVSVNIELTLSQRKSKKLETRSISPNSRMALKMFVASTEHFQEEQKNETSTHKKLRPHPDT